MHDHVTGRYIFGCKLLVCGYWNGDNFIPVDFSLHRERGGEPDKARAKRNRDYISGKEMDATTLRKRYQDKAKRNRRFNARYIKVPVWYDNRRVNLFFVKLGSGSKWKAFITNDLDIGFNKLMETYHIRWSCEVFFKDGKQHLQLGKCQCNNFDSQIGSTTLAMMQYIMLLLYKQMHYISTRFKKYKITLVDI